MQPMPQPMQQPLQSVAQPLQPVAQPLQPMPQQSVQPLQPAARPMQPYSTVAAPAVNPNPWAGRAPVNPYAVRVPHGGIRTRGTDRPAIKVFYDRSRAGDPFYFANPCAAVIDVDDSGDLTITPGCGDAALVIPASEIIALRVNVAVAKEAGAFHIETAKGFYLMLAAEHATRDESLDAVRSLRNMLHLGE
jgi:hypothetical protein